MKIKLEGVREEIRCPKCGRYDTDMGATHEEHLILKREAFDTGKIAYHTEIYCDCYEDSNNNGNCPTCDRDLELWDDDQRKLFNGGIDITCPCGAYIHATARVEYRTQLQRPKGE